MQQYYAKNPQAAYKRQGILTASPIELIIMLYDGCRKSLLLAQKAIGKSNLNAAHNHLIKAQDIISELMNSLDMNIPISQELMDLYEFLLRELAVINMEKDSPRIDPVLEIVTTLKETWEQVAAQQKGQEPPSVMTE